MADVTEKLKRQVRDWVSWADKYGISDDYEVNTLSLDMGTLRAMHSARDVDEGVVHRVAEAMAEAESWDGDPFACVLAKSELDNLARAAIAAMGEGDVR